MKINIPVDSGMVPDCLLTVKVLKVLCRIREKEAEPDCWCRLINCRPNSRPTFNLLFYLYKAVFRVSRDPPLTAATTTYYISYFTIHISQPLDSLRSLATALGQPHKSRDSLGTASEVSGQPWDSLKSLTTALGQPQKSHDSLGTA